MCMPNVRHLIEHLDVLGDYRQFAQDAESFGGDLEQMWAAIDNGADLLWFAAAVGVEPKQIIATACELLEEVFEQIETAGQETAQVLEAVHGWQRGERSADDVDQSGWDAYALIARMDPGKDLPPDANEVADAAVWLTYLVRDFPLQMPPDPTESDDVSWSGSAWMIVDHLAYALTSHQSVDESSPNRRIDAFGNAMRRFAITIRERITGIEVQAAVHQRGIWPFC